MKRYITAALTAVLVLGLLAVLIVVVGFVTPEQTTPTDPEGTLSPKLNYSLIISEICTKNESVITAPDGRHRDYIELYNAGETVDLAGVCFTDGKATSKPLEEAGEQRSPK